MRPRSRGRPAGAAVRWPIGASARTSSTACRAAASPAAASTRRSTAGPSRGVEDADWDDEPRTDRFARAEDEAPLDDAPRRERRPAADWLAEVTPRPVPEPAEEPDADEPLMLDAEIEAPKPRRTIVIAGHPDKLPAPRPRRPPRTAVERLGASPDRIMGYAVALGLLLILIAVLTTGH